MGQNGQIAISHDLTYFTMKTVLRQYVSRFNEYPPKINEFIIL